MCITQSHVYTQHGIYPQASHTHTHTHTHIHAHSRTHARTHQNESPSPPPSRHTEHVILLHPSTKEDEPLSPGSDVSRENPSSSSMTRGQPRGRPRGQQRGQALASRGDEDVPGTRSDGYLGASQGGEAEEDEEEEEPILTLKEALIWLAIDTALVSFFSELLVGSVEGSAEAWGIPKVFIGMVIIPIVGNAAEHASAVLVAMKGKVELALGIAIGSAVQIALLGVPIAVVCAWMMNKPLSLDFHVFETASVLTSSLAVGFLVSDGEANYLKGAMLVVAYIIVSAGFFVHKDDEQL